MRTPNARHAVRRIAILLDFVGRATPLTLHYSNASRPPGRRSRSYALARSTSSTPGCRLVTTLPPRLREPGADSSPLAVTTSRGYNSTASQTSQSNRSLLTEHAEESGVSLRLALHCRSSRQATGLPQDYLRENLRRHSGAKGRSCQASSTERKIHDRGRPVRRGDGWMDGWVLGGDHMSLNGGPVYEYV